MAPKKKKREPPDSFMSGILMPSVHCLSLPPNCSARSGVHLPCAVLNCSSLGRCSTLLRSQSLIRTLRVSTSKPFLAFVVDLIAHVGSVGVTLGSSNVGLNVIPEWQLPPVSPQFRRLVFRFALQNVGDVLPSVSWPGCRWAIRQFWSSDLNFLGTELLLCCIFFSSGIEYWGRLLFMCTACFRDHVSIPPSGHFVRVSPYLPMIS
uniref:Uncharacterized protein n=1 Tax=Opuntia streptacantha TaxID=393608 RepID=A0A7C9CKK5_OPUST